MVDAATAFSQLLAQLGPRRAADAMREILRTEPAPADQVLEIHYPPRPSKIPGAIEEQHVTYSQKPKSPAAIKRAGKPPRAS